MGDITPDAEVAPDLDFSGYVRWYSEHLRKTRGRIPSTNTVRTKVVYLRKLARNMDCTGEQFFGTLLADRARVSVLFDRLTAQVTPGAARNAYYALRSFGDYAKAMGWIAEHVVWESDCPAKNPAPPIVVYSDEEMRRLVDASRGYGDIRWWAFVTFLVDTGRRVGETLGLEWTHFRLDQRPPYVELPTTKNGDPQYVPLTRRLAEQVFTPENIDMLRFEARSGARRFGRDPMVHPFPWSYAVARGRWGRFCDRLGIDDRAMHCVRHAVITSRLAAGMPIHAVAALAGHRSVRTTESRYDHTSGLTFAGLIWEGQSAPTQPWEVS